MAELDLRTRSVLKTADAYVEALQEGQADWRDYYQVSSVLIGLTRADDEPDGE